jgi:hypothetical protein
MLAKLRAHLTYSNVMATVAVFVALGGTSYAIATGSIGSREIKNNSVGTKDLRNNGVRSRDVRNGSLLAADFKAGQLPAGERGPQGLQGLPGQDATKLFAYIRDPGNAAIEYGSGVAGITDPVGDNAYSVNFNRGVTNCVVLANAGIGDPGGSSVGKPATPFVSMNEGGPDGIVVYFTDPAGVIVDTAFMIAAFC